jgi:hypothetical protein
METTYARGRSVSIAGGIKKKSSGRLTGAEKQASSRQPRRTAFWKAQPIGRYMSIVEHQHIRFPVIDNGWES